MLENQVQDTLFYVGAISMWVSLLLVTVLIWYLWENCFAHCDQAHHKQHRWVMVLILSVPIWGWGTIVFATLLTLIYLVVHLLEKLWRD